MQLLKYSLTASTGYCTNRSLTWKRHSWSQIVFSTVGHMKDNWKLWCFRRHKPSPHCLAHSSTLHTAMSLQNFNTCCGAGGDRRILPFCHTPQITMKCIEWFHSETYSWTQPPLFLAIVFQTSGTLQMDFVWVCFLAMGRGSNVPPHPLTTHACFVVVLHLFG